MKKSVKRIKVFRDKMKKSELAKTGRISVGNKEISQDDSNWTGQVSIKTSFRGSPIRMEERTMTPFKNKPYLPHR